MTGRFITVEIMTMVNWEFVVSNLNADLPKFSPPLSHVVDISCGDNHTAIMTAGGGFYFA